MKRELNQEEKAALKMSVTIGVLLGIWINVLLLAGPFADFNSDYNYYRILIIKMSTIIVQTLATIAVTVGFTWAFIFLKINRWLSFISGILCGVIAGCITFGFTYAVMLSISITGGLVRIKGPEDFINTLPWWKMLGYTFVRGFNFGSFFGGVIGALAGPVISFNLGYGAKTNNENAGTE